MDQIGNESLDGEAIEFAVDRYSDFLDLQIEVLKDSGDLDPTEAQILETESFPAVDENIYGSDEAIAYDKALSKIAYGNISEAEKVELAEKHAITAYDVDQYKEDVEDVTIALEIDEFEFRSLAEEQYLVDRKEFGYENF
jgi:hypothetical protein